MARNRFDESGVSPSKTSTTSEERKVFFLIHLLSFSCPPDVCEPNPPSLSALFLVSTNSWAIWLFGSQMRRYVHQLAAGFVCLLFKCWEVSTKCDYLSFLGFSFVFCFFWLFFSVCWKVPPVQLEPGLMRAVRVLTVKPWAAEHKTISRKMRSCRVRLEKKRILGGRPKSVD